MKKLFFSFIFVIILISSCSQNEEVQVESSDAFIGGSKGVEVSFLEGAPVNEFVAGESVPVVVSLKNSGEYDLAGNSLEVRLWGLDMEAYGLSSEYKIVNCELRGIKKGLIEEGSETILEMGDMNYLGSIANSLDVTLRSEICYPYKTKANLNVCISSNSISNDEEEFACTISGNKVKSGSVSSGPIQLTSLTQQFEGNNNLVFKFKLSNSGEGNVYSLGNSCTELIDSSAERLNEDIVHITLPEDFSCFFTGGEESNEGDVRLISSEKIFTCYLEVENQGFSFERNLEVILDYKYTQTSKVDFKILES